MDFCCHEQHNCCSIISTPGFIFTPNQERLMQKQSEGKTTGCGHAQGRTQIFDRTRTRSVHALIPPGLSLAWMAGPSMWGAA